MDAGRKEINVFRQLEENIVALKREMALKSIKIRKLGIEDLEQVLHIQEIITRNKIGPKKTSY